MASSVLNPIQQTQATTGSENKIVTSYKELAQQLLKKYEEVLKDFEFQINHCKAPPEDREAVPLILLALKAIAGEQEFNFEQFPESVARWDLLTKDPAAVLLKLLLVQINSRDGFCNYFSHLIQFYELASPESIELRNRQLAAFKEEAITGLISILSTSRPAENSPAQETAKTTQTQTTQTQNTILSVPQKNKKTPYISAMVVGGFIAALGFAVIALAFALLNVASLGIVGIAMAATGATTALVSLGLFVQSNKTLKPQIRTESEPVMLHT